ncbi:MAG: hypothetical protein HUU27_09665, partial [Phycisphaerae bacterium]|nr:hypothetical protein [Phycisphaerae bacterium]
GALGTAFIAFAALLGARRRALLLRLGPMSAWLRGHLWLGLLSLPVILLHGAFQFGGTLTTVLMCLLIAIVVSGVYGAILQHAMPRLITTAVPQETTYEQIERRLAEMRVQALAVVAEHCPPDTPEIAQFKQELSETLRLTGEEQPEFRKGPAVKVAADADEAAKAAAAEQTAAIEKGLAALLRFYGGQVAPFLRNCRSRRPALASAVRASIAFDAVRTDIHPGMEPALRTLEELCGEARQKARQIRLHRVLHGWLLLHIPLTTALLVLTAVHMVMALYY